MSDIKNVVLESGIENVFQLIVPVGPFAGTYGVEMPDGWDDIDVSADVDEEFFYIDNFILGEQSQLAAVQYYDPEAFDILQKMYKRYGGDAVVYFKWFAGGVDILGDNFEINFNKYKESYDQSMLKIEYEIKRRESHNKLFTREDVSVNIFAEEDLDELPIDDVPLTHIVFKENARMMSNFHFYREGQIGYTLVPDDHWMFEFTRSDEYDFGVGVNNNAGMFVYGAENRDYGPFLTSNITINNLQVEISNLSMRAIKETGYATLYPELKLFAKISNYNGTWSRFVELAVGVNDDTIPGQKSRRIDILNQTFDLGYVGPNDHVWIYFVSTDNAPLDYLALRKDTSFEFKYAAETPLRKTQTLRLIDAVNQVIKNYTNGEITAQSDVIGSGGRFYNTAVSSGIFMRGLPEVYTDGRKITTNLSSLMYKAAAPLLALGFDVKDNLMKIEEVSWFFKNEESVNLTSKPFVETDFVYDNDIDNTFNTLIFGSNKYSTSKKNDLNAYNTKVEYLTPIKSVKQKFEKATDAIIDEFKIQELINDQSTSTNNSDDDLVFIDLVNVTNVTDGGTLKNTTHYENGGYLWINSYDFPFDLMPITVSSNLTITAGLNVGTWQVLEIDGAKIKLNKTSGIQVGTTETQITFSVASAIKNRGIEGFTNVYGIYDTKTTANLRHNPKFQMSRWFPFFGSGLIKKTKDDKIKVTNYKNNGAVTLQVNSTELEGDMTGIVTLNDDEKLQRMRMPKNTLFSNMKVEITLMEVGLSEFLTAFNTWRDERGYWTVNSPYGSLQVFPFGDKAFAYDKSRNELTVRGKVHTQSAGVILRNPVLESVTALTPTTVEVAWNLNGMIYDYGDIYIQISKDGVNWEAIGFEPITATTNTYFDVPMFYETLIGTPIHFRVVIDSDIASGLTSNIITKTDIGNSFVFNEISRTTNYNCVETEVIFEVGGTGSFTFDADFFSSIESGRAELINQTDNAVVFDFTSFMYDHTETDSATIVLSNETKTFRLHTIGATVYDGNFLSCSGAHNVTMNVESTLSLEITDGSNTVTVAATAESTKGYRDY